MREWGKILQNLSGRSAEKINVYKDTLQNSQNIFINASNDWGIARNGGRIGARFAPEAIINVFSKMSATANHEQKWMACEIDHPNFGEDFDQYQAELKLKITDIFNNAKANKFIHIGGGHDHIFPYLSALEKKCKKVVVFNIDAHLDTRTDELHHSGTPFRQFAKQCSVDFELIQLGIHDYSNPKSNYQPLERGEMHIHSFSQLKKLTYNFSDPQSLFDKYKQAYEATEFVFSLDCDAISAYEMSAVSAVNHQGLSVDFIQALMDGFLSIPAKKYHFGIYEYNPLYDDLSQKGARALAALAHQFLYN